MSRRRWAARRRFFGYLFVSPAALLLAIFSFIAIFVSLVLSFTDWAPLNLDWKFVGLDNYRETADSGRYWRAFRNTAQYVGLSTPSIIVGSLGLALVANQARQLRSVFRTLFFLPTITPSVVLAMVWVWIYTPDGGLNSLLEIVGIIGPNWLSQSTTAMPAIVLLAVWTSLGYYMIIFLAGLADIPVIYYEAAKVDGAGALARFRYITIPLLRNSLIFVLITLVIYAFQVFTQMYIMTEGGPGGATESVQWEIYRNAFVRFSFGVASAMSWVLFGVIFIFTAIQLQIFVSRQIY